MRRNVALCVALIVLIGFSVPCGPHSASAAPGRWQKKVARSVQRERPAKDSRHRDTSRGSEVRSPNNCTYAGGLSYQADSQGLNYGHGLAQVVCPTGKPPGRRQRRQVTIHDLIVEAQTKLAPPKPLVQTAPPRGKRELVGIPTWVWLDKSQWGTRESSASAGGLSVAITASAYELVIDPGDGSNAIVCNAPWTPYIGDPEEKSSCTHTFTHSGSYTITVTARWGADWSGSGGGGTLPTINRSVSFPVTVVQARSELIANP